MGVIPSVRIGPGRKAVKQAWERKVLSHHEDEEPMALQYLLTERIGQQGLGHLHSTYLSFPNF